MDARKSLLALVGMITLSLTVSCAKKKSDSESEPETLALTLGEPVEMINTSLAAMGSAMDTDISTAMVSSLALPLGSAGFTLDDCGEKATPLSRSGDDANYVDSSNQLKISHPRMPIQDFYCKMNKDSFAADSFLGAISESRMVICFLGAELEFDGVARTKQISEEEFKSCLASNLSAAKKEEVYAEITGDIVLDYTPTKLDKVGKEGEWDVSISTSVDVGGNKSEMQILLKDSNDTLAVSALRGATKAKSPDSYVVSINKKLGEVRFEGKFQRIRFPDGSSNNGWNQHSRIVTIQHM